MNRKPKLVTVPSKKPANILIVDLEYITKEKWQRAKEVAQVVPASFTNQQVKDSVRDTITALLKRRVKFSWAVRVVIIAI